MASYQRDQISIGINGTPLPTASLTSAVKITTPIEFEMGASDDYSVTSNTKIVASKITFTMYRGSTNGTGYLNDAVMSPAIRNLIETGGYGIINLKLNSGSAKSANIRGKFRRSDDIQAMAATEVTIEFIASNGLDIINFLANAG